MTRQALIPFRHLYRKRETGTLELFLVLFEVFYDLNLVMPLNSLVSKLPEMTFATL